MKTYYIERSRPKFVVTQHAIKAASAWEAMGKCPTRPYDSTHVMQPDEITAMRAKQQRKAVKKARA